MRHVAHSFVEWIGKPELLEQFEKYYFSFETYLNWKSLFSLKESSFLESLRSYKRVNAVDNGNLTNKQKIGSIAYFLIVPQIVSALSVYSAKIREQRRQRAAQHTANNINTSANTTEHSLSADGVIFEASEPIQEPNGKSETPTSTNTLTRITSTTIQRLNKIAQSMFTFIQTMCQILIENWAEFHPYLVTTVNAAVVLNKLLHSLNVVDYHHPLFGLLDMRLVKNKGNSRSGTGNANRTSATNRTTNPTNSTFAHNNSSNIDNTTYHTNTSTTTNIVTNTTSSNVLSTTTLIFSLMFAMKLAQYFTVNNSELSASSLRNKLTKPKVVPKPPIPAKIG